MAVSNLNVRVGADTRGLRADLKMAEMSFKQFNGTVAGMQSTLNAAFGGFAVFQGLSYAIKEIASLEYELDSVRALTGATERQFQALSDNAKKLGAETRFTAQEIAKLQQEYGRLGFSTNEILKVTDSTTKLSIATGEDLAEAALIAGTTLRQYNLDASEMGRVNDVIAASLNKSALDLNTFAEAMKYVGPVAASAGVSLEETAAMISVLADSGIKGSQAGTSLRRILTDMAATGKPAKEALREVAMQGIDLTDAMDEVGRYAQTALLVLSNQTVKLDDLTGSYQNANGELDKMAKIMEDNLIGDWHKFTSAVDGAIQKGNGVLPVLRSLVQWGTKFINIGSQSNWTYNMAVYAANVKKANEETLKLNQTNELIAKGIEEAFNSGDATAFVNEIEKVKMSGIQAKDILADQTGEYQKQLKYLQYTHVIAEIKVGVEEQAKKIEQEKLNILIQQTQKLQDQQAIYQKNIGANRMDSVASMRKSPTGIVGLTDTFDQGATLERMGEGIGKLTFKTDHYAEAVKNLGVVWTDTSYVMINASIALQDMLANLTAGVAEFVGMLASGNGNAEAFSDSIIEPIGNMAVQLGKLTIAAGFAILGFQQSLLTLNPVPAIAAGAALVAIGSAIKGMANNGSSSGGGSGGGAYGGSGGGYSQPQFDVQISGEFVMRGDSMVAVIDRTTQKQRYTKG
jgi:hypothetical protein